MELVADLAARSLLLFGLLLFSCQMVAYRLGYVLGHRSRAAGRAQSADGVGLVVSSLLALLAFTLALTLSFASSRYSERRAGVLSEAKAIGTAWLRADAMRKPARLRICSSGTAPCGATLFRSRAGHQRSKRSMDAPLSCNRKSGIISPRSCGNVPTTSRRR